MYAVQPTGYHPQESDWKDYHLYNAQQLPRSVRWWLLDPGSLTQRLVKSSQGHFRVQVLSQCWQQPRISEAELLRVSHRQMAIIREVVLLCHGQPWVFARSVIPINSLTGRLRRLRKFSDQSLGEMLFRDSSMHRHSFEVTQINGLSEQLPSTLRQNTLLWGRRCRFELMTKPLMVSEIFLPDFQP